MSNGLLKGGTILSVGQAASLAFAFVRTFVIAKFIGDVNLGISTGFLITVGAVELTSDIGMQKQVVQSEHADDADFLGTAHATMLLRGFLLSIILYLSSGFCAQQFNAPEAKWAFQWLALVPIIKGLMNLDVIRSQRQMKFGPFVFSEFVGHFCALIVGVVAAVLTRSYTAVLLAILAQYLFSTIATLWLAKHPYRIAWKKEYATDMFHYGWPLVFSGLLMFIGLFADQIIIAKYFGAAVLGNYGLALRLTSVPMAAAIKVFISIFLPILSRLKSPGEFEASYLRVSKLTSTSAAILGVSAAVLFPVLIRVIYQTEFPLAPQLVALLGLLTVVRLLRSIPAQAMLALAETRGLFVGNVVRAIGIPVAFFAAWRGTSIEAVVWIIIIAETLALAAATAWLKRSHDIRIITTSSPMAVCIAIVSSFFFLERLPLGATFQQALAAVGIVVICGLSWHAFLIVNSFRHRDPVKNHTQVAHPAS